MSMKRDSSSLWQQVTATAEKALETGALQPVATHLEVLPDGGIAFGVRVVNNLNRKAAFESHRKEVRSAPANPFLPYEKALFVKQLAENHVCLLNKFNVVDYHLLIITQAYEAQDSWLTIADFEALVSCMCEIDGLGFYNGGQEAGASQHHKHLQLIPFPAAAGMSALPVAAKIAAAKDELTTQQNLSVLPFRHTIYSLQSAWSASPIATIAANLFAAYRRVVAELGLNLELAKPNLPYNLLITREWMMGIRRSQASYQGIGVNSLGYAGWLLVKNQSELERLKQIGPINLLQTVSTPKLEF